MWAHIGVVVAGLAAVAAGLQAGLYYGFSCGVMPGLARGDDRTFVTAMQQVNAAIVTPWFLVTFLGAPLLAALAVVLQLGQRGPALVWAILGFVLAAATVVITMVVNVPLNDALDAAGASDPDQARAAFEAVWVRWNTVRALTSTGSLVALLATLTTAARGML